MSMKPTEVLGKNLPVWDVDQYMYEDADGGSVVTIYSNDMFQDNPTYQYFQLTCHGATYDRLLSAMEQAVRLEIEEPYDANAGIFTQVQLYDEHGDSECIVVGEIRLPNRKTSMNHKMEISELTQFIKQIKEQSN